MIRSRAQLDTGLSSANAFYGRDCNMAVRKPLTVQRVRELEREQRRRAERRRARVDFLIGVIGVLLIMTVAVFAAHRSGLLHRAKSEIRHFQVFGKSAPLDEARSSRFA